VAWTRDRRPCAAPIMVRVPEWFFAALSGGALRGAERSWSPERKSAALLAYLALEGPTARSRLAGLLWPEAPEPAARNNLAQAVRRLRVACGADVVVGGDRLALGDLVRCDAAHFDPLTEPPVDPRALLASHDYDDCPEFAEWLEGARERLRRQTRAAWRGRAEGFEAAGTWREALAAHDRLLDLESLDEAAHRGRMRTLHRLGEGAAALQAFVRCRAEWHCRAGRLDDAERAAAAACGWAERGCDVGGVLDALNTLAGTLVERGRHRDAAAWLERAVALCRLHAAPELPTAINNLALVRQAVGALHEALERHAEAFGMARAQGPRPRPSSGGRASSPASATT
jgi:tetratricopeptide (TPR) repeat protein